MTKVRGEYNKLVTTTCFVPFSGDRPQVVQVKYLHKEKAVIAIPAGLKCETRWRC